MAVNCSTDHVRSIARFVGHSSGGSRATSAYLNSKHTLRKNSLNVKHVRCQSFAGLRATCKVINEKDWAGDRTNRDERSCRNFIGVGSIFIKLVCHRYAVQDVKGGGERIRTQGGGFSESFFGKLNECSGTSKGSNGAAAKGIHRGFQTGSQWLTVAEKDSLSWP